jgi:hypothetical protein
MPRKPSSDHFTGQLPLDGLAPLTPARPQVDLTIKPGTSQPLSPAQEEFNKRMKALEKARAAYDRKRARLDADLVVCRNELMPMVEKRNRLEHQMILLVAAARQARKMTERRRRSLEDLLFDKAQALLGDPVGLGEEELATLEALFEELAALQNRHGEGDPENEEDEDPLGEQFQEMRTILEAVARDAGIELDLSDLDHTMDPVEFQRLLRERFEAGEKNRGDAFNFGPGRKRKPSKAALERERLKKEAEEAKNRDFKSLYKQLAKVLHPDLETDPTLKEHKEAWMKRLTTARAQGDLREMLAIELEWLGEEAGNLALATDEKLRVYSMVLKEQIAEIKERTRLLACETEYLPIRRFLSPFADRVPVPVFKHELQEEIDYLSSITSHLRAGGAAAVRTIHQFADQHARIFGI